MALVGSSARFNLCFALYAARMVGRRSQSCLLVGRGLYDVLSPLSGPPTGEEEDILSLNPQVEVVWLARSPSGEFRVCERVPDVAVVSSLAPLTAPSWEPRAVEGDE